MSATNANTADQSRSRRSQSPSLEPRSVRDSESGASGPSLLSGPLNSDRSYYTSEGDEQELDIFMAFEEAVESELSGAADSEV